MSKTLVQIVDNLLLFVHNWPLEERIGLQEWLDEQEQIATSKKVKLND